MFLQQKRLILDLNADRKTRRPHLAFGCVLVLLSILAATSFGATQKRAARIRAFAKHWKGTRYLWGGTGRAGIDCSAYLRQMYRKLFDVELPRTTRQQIKLGVDLPLNPNNLSQGLEPGDVIFYVNSSGVPNHVVVYAGRNRITHSESGRGVVVDRMRRLRGRRVAARRFLLPAGGGRFAEVPQAGALKTQEIPCPVSVVARRSEIQRYSRQTLDQRGIAAMGARDICDFRVLAQALKKRGQVGKENAERLIKHAQWLQDIEFLEDQLTPQY